MNPKKPRNVKQRIAAGLVVAGVVSAVGSFALFTDHAQSHAEMTAGTLDLTLTQSWVADNAAVADEYAPGDILNLDYTLQNTGSLSTDIRETFVITADKAIDGIFDIYAAEDVEQNSATHMFAPKAGKNPLSVRTTGTFTGTDGKTYYTITYEVPELTVDGSVETGDATASTAGSKIAGAVKTGDYVLLFDEDAANDVQGTNLTLEYIAQGLQHRNTGNDTWADAKVITEKLTIGGVERNVMPENN